MATVAQIDLRAVQRADMEHSGSSSSTSTERLPLMNKWRNALFALLVESGLDSVPESEYDITADGSATYALPDDYYSAVSVFHLEGDTVIARLGRHSGRTYPESFGTDYADTYRIFGYRTDAVIQFAPRPASGNYKVVYVPAPTDLVATTDEVDGVLGWEEFIVCGMAKDMLIKDNAPGPLIGLVIDDLDRMEKRIRQEGMMRDLAEQKFVENTRRSSRDRLPGDFPRRGWKGAIR